MAEVDGFSQYSDVPPATERDRLDKSRKAIMRQYAPAVLAICLAQVRNLHDAEDLAQEVLIKAWDKLDTLRDQDRARAWLVQTARRMCVDYYRRQPPPKPLPEELSARTDPVDPRIESLHAALSQLSGDYREPITLYYLDGKNSQQVAAALGISESTVRQRLHRARLKLHEILTRDEL